MRIVAGNEFGIQEEVAGREKRDIGDVAFEEPDISSCGHKLKFPGDSYQMTLVAFPSV